RVIDEIVADQDLVVLGTPEPVFLIEVAVDAVRDDERVVLPRFGGGGDHRAEKADRRKRQPQCCTAQKGRARRHPANPPMSNDFSLLDEPIMAGWWRNGKTETAFS